MTYFRIIVFIGLNIKYVSNSESVSDPGVAIISPVLLRQSQLLYALLSAAIPSLNQYLRKFDTTKVSQFGYRPDQYGSADNTYQLDSISNQRSQDRIDDSTKENESGKAKKVSANSTGINFNSTGYSQYQARIEGPNNGKEIDLSSNTSQGEGSIGRANSEEHIIRKDVVYEVRPEP